MTPSPGQPVSFGATVTPSPGWTFSLLASVTPLPGDGLSAGSSAAAPTSSGQLWLRIVDATPAFSLAMQPLWTAQPGEWYAVRQVEDGWALVVWELDPPEWQEWVQIDGRVELSRPLIAQ